jgi:hypothetical protein
MKWDPQGQLLASCSDDMTLKVCKKQKNTLKFFTFTYFDLHINVKVTFYHVIK